MGINFQVGRVEPAAQPEKEKSVKEIVDSVKAPVKVEINMTKIKEMFDLAEEHVKNMKALADAIEVTDNESQERAIEMGLSVAALEKMIERKRVEIKAPYLKFGQTLDGLCRPIKKITGSITKSIKAKIKAHVDTVEAIEVAARAKEEAERKKAEALSFVKPDPVTTPEPAPSVPVKHETKSGSASVGKKWIYSILHEPDIPSRYMIPNDKLIKEAIDRGLRDIPGLRIFQDSNIKLTRKR